MTRKTTESDMKPVYKLHDLYVSTQTTDQCKCESCKKINSHVCSACGTKTNPITKQYLFCRLVHNWTTNVTVKFCIIILTAMQNNHPMITH